MDWDDSYDQFTIERAKREERHRTIEGIVSTILLAVIFVTFVIASAVRADGAELDPFRIRVYPEAQLWRRDVQIRVSVFIEPNGRNHCVTLDWYFTYPGGGGSSTWEVDARSQRQFVRHVKYATPGYVWISATLHYFDEEGKEHHKKLEVKAIVKGSEELE